MTNTVMDTERQDTKSDTWVATDALGRTLPGFEECGPTRPGKYVGIFYFLWLGQHGRTLYDNTKILATNPANPQYGPAGAFHWWDESHLGYYLSDDDFVIRKHAQMLTDAGIDVLFFDVTNGFTYDENYLLLCRVFEDIRKNGKHTPQIAFLANSNSATVVKRLYDRFYSKALYPELWFWWKGKPLILTPEDGLTSQLKEFFTVRHSWAWSNPNGWFGDGKDKWPWLDHYPQQPGWHDNPDSPEESPVCAAQHPTSNIGRSFHNGKQPLSDQIASDKGLCFAEQWRRALEVDAELIFITGWNEWVAQRFVKQANQPPGQFIGRKLEVGETFFVDQYDQEYSRDIEPMRGAHSDNYYYQMVDGIRRFKGVRQRAKASAPKTIRINSDFDQWREVAPEFWDDVGDTTHRNHPAWEPLKPYVNTTGRNDFDLMKVSRDEQNLYFYVRTREPITPPNGSNWMLLFLDTDGNPRNGWEGYDFVVNRTIRNEKTSVLERNAGGWNWEPVTEVKFLTFENEMHLAIPRNALGLEPEKGALQLDFKWADNVPDSGDILDFIDQGDVAPNGRFNYRYECREKG